MTKLKCLATFNQIHPLAKFHNNSKKRNQMTKHSRDRMEDYGEPVSKRICKSTPTPELNIDANDESVNPNIDTIKLSHLDTMTLIKAIQLIITSYNQHKLNPSSRKTPFGWLNLTSRSKLHENCTRNYYRCIVMQIIERQHIEPQNTDLFNDLLMTFYRILHENNIELHRDI